MHFTLHLSPRCNMRCGYCYSPPADGPAMTPEIGRRVLDMAAQTGEKSCGSGTAPQVCSLLKTCLVWQDD
ncbi:MAG TPA: hypothetical protein PKK44_04900 [Candidatus Hydrogenedentes bacterium]|nr:hypothetical protein [Candidatus Hydrogenedentota bacterium]HNZ17641.1 hypothetical protein [Candidatus Hydrogenedentota bacterium]HOH33378.1 hypothetical protein [Candidatus Hydrogenedentota bacterium]HPV38627.1 hypothetical protein [Candidatus Hydrogenedentota bacterium]